MGTFQYLTKTIHDEIAKLYHYFNASTVSVGASSSESLLDAISDNPDFIPINYGSYSVVFKYKDYPYIFKCSSFLNDGWLAFAEYSRIHPSKYLPEIYDIYQSSNMYVACTEELEPIADDYNIELKSEYEDQGTLFNACMDLSYIIDGKKWDESTAQVVKEEILNSYTLDETFLDKNLDFISVMNSTIKTLMDQGYTDDLHYGNVMIRDKYQIVLNDPVQ